MKTILTITVLDIVIMNILLIQITVTFWKNIGQSTEHLTIIGVKNFT